MSHGETAALRWRRDLQRWKLPQHIRDNAPVDPYVHSPAEFRAQDDAPLTASHRAAIEALSTPGTVLDIGAGGGAMSRPLRGRATHITAVDVSSEMLAACEADERIAGRWPDVASSVAGADVVVCGHVLYNVPDIVEFIAAAAGAARRRVVVEITASHPWDTQDQRALWRQFWGLEIPSGPTWEAVLEVMRDLGINAGVERWQRAARYVHPSLDALVASTRRRLCLPATRDDEVRAALVRTAARGAEGWASTAGMRELVTIWWDIRPPG